MNFNYIVKGVIVLMIAAPLQADVSVDFIQAQELLAKRSDPARWFITDELKPTERLILLLKLDNLYDPNDGLKEIVEKTQKAWLQVGRGTDKTERTDLVDTPEQREIRQQVEAIVDELGLFSAREPALKHYDYGGCLGAFVDGVRLRLSYLIEQWKKGVRFDTLVFFTGERYLRKDNEDSLEKLINPKNSRLTIKADWKMPADAPYETEYDMCRLIWEQTQIPQDMLKALDGKVVFVNAKRRAGQERIGTRDIYGAWMADLPKQGTILAASHPMYWPFQQLAGKNALGDKYLLDTCGDAATIEVRERYKNRIVSLVQDTAAKCLYEISQRKTNKVR